MCKLTDSERGRVAFIVFCIGLALVILLIPGCKGCTGEECEEGEAADCLPDDDDEFVERELSGGIRPEDLPDGAATDGAPSDANTEESDAATPTPPQPRGGGSIGPEGLPAFWQYRGGDVGPVPLTPATWQLPAPGNLLVEGPVPPDET